MRTLRFLAASLFLFLPVAALAAHDFGAQAQFLETTFPFPVASLVGGFFATVVMSLSIMLLRTAVGIHMNIPLMLGSMMVPGASNPWQQRVGMTTHLVIGSLWGLVFGFLLEFHIFFQEISVLNGILFAFFPWISMMLVIMPMSKRGLFGLKEDNRVWIATLIGHIAYGAALNLFIPLIFFG